MSIPPPMLPNSLSPSSTLWFAEGMLFAVAGDGRVTRYNWFTCSLVCCLVFTAGTSSVVMVVSKVLVTAPLDIVRGLVESSSFTLPCVIPFMDEINAASDTFTAKRGSKSDRLISRCLKKTKSPIRRQRSVGRKKQSKEHLLCGRLPRTCCAAAMLLY